MHKEIVRGLSAPGGPRVHLLTSATLPDTSTAAPIANDRRAWWLLLGCYLLLRLPLLALNGLDLDEATSTTVAAQNPLAIIRTSATNDIHPPLFYLLLWPFRQM
ncbi:MAG TPA: hypothetical protein VEI97_01985, partial [bacterium]|nr:hypothetical protein [bacterium]